MPKRRYKTYEELAAEIERLRAAGLYLVQQDNGGSCLNRGGRPCRELDKCGCYLEFVEVLNQQLPAEK